MKKYMSVILLCGILLHGTPSFAQTDAKTQSVRVAVGKHLAIAVGQNPNATGSVAVNSTAKAKGKLHNKADVIAKDGDVEIKVNKNNIKPPTAEDRERERKLKKEKDNKLSLKYGAQYVFFGILAFLLRMYQRK